MGPRGLSFSSGLCSQECTIFSTRDRRLSHWRTTTFEQLLQNFEFQLAKKWTNSFSQAHCQSLTFCFSVIFRILVLVYCAQDGYDLNNRAWLSFLTCLLWRDKMTYYAGWGFQEVILRFIPISLHWLLYSVCIFIEIENVLSRELTFSMIVKACGVKSVVPASKQPLPLLKKVRCFSID